MASFIYCILFPALVTLLVLAWADQDREQGHTFYGIETEIIDLFNNQGQISNGKFCDVMTKCDPVIYGFIDIEKPISPWPGAIRRLEDHEYIGGHTNTDNVRLNKIIGKVICGGAFNTVNLRVEVYDHDIFTQSDLIEQFNCFFVPHIVADSPLLSTWSETRVCKGIHNPNNTRLTYRWRLHALPASACGLRYNEALTLASQQKPKRAVV
ncbi:uncharacterized protein LOC129592085 [Paramacrobiotus metropolitanus]|uniref:uncharacterized protein LOC129592085 n=1 Tax=Paramacrobiotus metropolitanus TaxID=2943436 RepID=UPI0024461C76|nr:uncharacterized protein LOC129592085 [Paramacrobiotus metropolitanus]